ncbi:phenylalanine--tRNA ligase subunit beta [Buchananella hordeovulneris]|uniref:phenylalanine--tRNA ligase subunit beta n=1 Tax=Buchananella hordeovulneris TaxID=52770 RepID=UPI000F5E65DF|nr:phenylalanine--tRNA ligase subunit beta [Buchananella hordeovulneris]RRD51752.1 phenylalanine--tRNA ligase subunit beta [Buchananella hordeovulneris]
MPRIDLEWLADHVDLSAAPTAEQLAAALVQVGIEEETIWPPAVTGPLVVGRVLTMDSETHKNGKTINYCRVDVGEHNDEPGTGKEPSDLPSRGIVCGAHNFAPGDWVVVSLPGTVLPGPFPIAGRKTYGHWSDGMICSERELGFSDEHDGIIVLTRLLPDQEFFPGQDAVELLGLGAQVLEVNITPDRGYCFSMRGLAREYSHSTGAAFKDPALPGVLTTPAPQGEGFPVELADAAPIHGVAGCDVFTTRIVHGIDPAAPTPRWMVRRLVNAGMRPISLAVDVTNYVMLDLGQPLHAYDLDQVSAPLVVRRARPGERLRTLDDVDRQLDGEDLVIADSPDTLGSRVLGLAGVMGGATSEVGPTTRDVLIEAAHFDPVTVARTARRHKLPSEAAKRFERGVDPLTPQIASQRVVDLLVEYGGGEADPTLHIVGQPHLPAPVDFPLAEVARLTGLELPENEIVALLAEIGCEVSGSGPVRQVTPPSWRTDLTGPAHFVEEVARLKGYDAIGSLLPVTAGGGGLTDAQRRRRELAAALALAGMSEILTDPFVGDVSDALGYDADDERRVRLRLANPLADDAPFLRSSLLETLLAAARRNVSRGLNSVALYEFGLVAQASTARGAAPVAGGQLPGQEVLAQLFAATPRQCQHAAGVFVGQAQQAGPLVPSRAYDWADAVEAVRLLARVAGAELEVRQARRAPWHPGRCAALWVGETCVGYAGELHPDVCEAFSLPPRTCAFEVNVEAAFTVAAPEVLTTRPISTFPAAKEDFSFVVARTCPANAVAQVVRQALGDLAEDVHIFDVYTGSGIAADQQAVAVSVRLRAADRTLTADDLATARRRVISAVEAEVGGQLRG